MNLANFSCRNCLSSEAQSLLSLGSLPLANNLLNEADLKNKEEYFDLELVLCNRCALVQITEVIPPEKLFDNYLYLSSYSETMLRHSKSLVEELTLEEHLAPSSLVLEIASNDGYLLQFYKDKNIPVIGIEPAANIAKIAENNGIKTLTKFFSLELAKELAMEGVEANVIHAHNVLAHVPNLSGFVSGIEILLSQSGVAVIEVPYVRNMIDSLEFDTIYHEHLSYFSLTALKNLFESNGLTVSKVEQVEIHGGSLRIYAKKPGCTVDPSVKKLLQEEDNAGVCQFDYYQNFASRVNTLKSQLFGLLQDLKSQGKSISAYGASAKGSTLMNFVGIDSSILDFVVDRSTIKQSKLTPGNHLPIYDPEIILEEMPDYLLLLTWNFAAEILEQQSKYRELGGKFIIPLPEPTVV